MKKFNMKKLLLSLLTVATVQAVSGQQALSIQTAMDSAYANNRYLKLKDLQLHEKEFSVNDAKLKYYPIISVNSNYQYNSNIGQLVIPYGSFGSLPVGGTVVPLPNEEKIFDLGTHQVFNAGATIYQPITQLGKISSNVADKKIDVQMVEAEKQQVEIQVRQNIEKLFFAIEITKARLQEAQYLADLSSLRLNDLKNAVDAGKSIELNQAGLQASEADYKSKVLNYKVALEDYYADLNLLTGIDARLYTLDIQVSSKLNEAAFDVKNNVSYTLSNLSLLKADNGIKASKRSMLPELGVFVGYNYQRGNVIFPENNPYAGAKLTWNIQDVLSYNIQQKQRTVVKEQAQVKLEQVEDELNIRLGKAVRKNTQYLELIQVAEQALDYREKEMALSQEKMKLGLMTNKDLMEIGSRVAKAKVDLLQAKLAYLLNQQELKEIVNQ